MGWLGSGRLVVAAAVLAGLVAGAACGGVVDEDRDVIGEAEGGDRGDADAPGPDADADGRDDADRGADADGDGDGDGDADADGDGDGDGDADVSGFCGDGVVDGDEECDEGRNNSDERPDACRTNCRRAHCGDRVADSGEQCDDGNREEGDGCEPDCSWSCEEDPECSDRDDCDGIERCESHRCVEGLPLPEGADCVTVLEEPGVCRGGLCAAISCGNEVIDPGEECDDGNDVNTDDCLSNCFRASCGDGWVWSGREACDGADPRVCSSSCGTAGRQPCADCEWAECEPPAESCNGNDDDCDGDRDEDFACIRDTEGPCLASCGTVGEHECGSDCTWGECLPPDETCNGDDDDCDTVPDDGFTCVRGAVDACPTTCSSVGEMVCTDECDWGGCVPPDETCNGADDDCDTVPDNGFECTGDMERSCTTECDTYGTQTCDGCAWGDCVPPPETCNGDDDDCDTLCDEGSTCCARSTAGCTVCGGTGTMRCKDDCSAWSDCTRAEVCNDCDDDGDGLKDEDFACTPPGSTGNCAVAGCDGVHACSSTCAWGTCNPATAPTPLWPPNGAYTGTLLGSAASRSLRPLFRWLGLVLPTCAAGTLHYNIQVDNSCSTPGFATCGFPSPEVDAAAMAMSFTPSADLLVSTGPPVGRRYYWRVRACFAGGGCGPWSPVRYLEVGRDPNDFNGDGFADVAVGAYNQNGTTMTGEGKVFVYHGAATGVPTTPALTLDCPSPRASAYFGRSVAAAGDVNGDGFVDLVVGAPRHYDDVAGEGQAFVYHGGVSGLSTRPARTLDNPGDQANAQFGAAVAGAGDVSGDGFADVIVGAPLYDNGAPDEGNAFVYYGSATGVPTAPSVSLDDPGNEGGATFGAGVASAGDVNADGFGDVIVGAPVQSAGTEEEGNAFVYLGSSRGLGAEPALTLDNPEGRTDGQFGTSVAAAGDTNGDGYGDVVVGAPGNGADHRGGAYVYRGSSTGLPATPSATLSDPDGTMIETGFGFAVAHAGDVNTDGFADIVVGAPFQDAGSLNEGNAFVYRGSNSGTVTTPYWNLDCPGGEVEARFGWSVAPAGDVNGDGYSDLVVGVPWHDIPTAGPTIIDAGAAHVYHGGASLTPAGPNVTLEDPPEQGNAYFGFSVW